MWERKLKDHCQAIVGYRQIKRNCTATLNVIKEGKVKDDSQSRVKSLMFTPTPQTAELTPQQLFIRMKIFGD